MATFGALALATVVAGPVPDPSCGVFAVVQQSQQVQYALPRTFLRANSDSVWTHAGPWRLGADYALDRTHGELRLLRAPMPGETLWVRAC
ncbi:MAG TPA: hypothetical protein VEY91_04260, partial [Candidatus Limnocylindria bacterium]|nr:hypothetical protein [Candidatus Limnocylindria bacterium]